MTKDEALRLALEALEFANVNHWWGSSNIEKAITAIKAALEAKDEPVAWLHRFIEGGISIGLKPLDLERHPERWEPLYTTPPQQELVCVCGAVWEGQELVETPPKRTWVGLTEAECGVLWKVDMTPFDYYQAIEAKLKQKNT
jgi:hypothetical protein